MSRFSQANHMYTFEGTHIACSVGLANCLVTYWTVGETGLVHRLHTLWGLCFTFRCSFPYTFISIYSATHWDTRGQMSWGHSTVEAWEICSMECWDVGQAFVVDIPICTRLWYHGGHINGAISFLTASCVLIMFSVQIQSVHSGEEGWVDSVECEDGCRLSLVVFI